MSTITIQTRAALGLDAPAVSVEAHISNGLPRFHIVGLPEAVVKESKERVRSALLNSRFEFPIRHITINLAPADLPKDGGRFDLPIALGILVASRQLAVNNLADFEFAGELALSGELRPFQGCLPFAIATRNANRLLIIPAENAIEAALLQNSRVLPAQHLLEVCAHLNNQKQIALQENIAPISENTMPDLQDVYGQQHAKRALEIAAAGGHNMLMVGPPGTGKTMLASRLPGILPRLNEQQALETAALLSISCKKFTFTHWRQPPFRAPHHTASSIALVGGGSPPRPGEISLAHHGILFLDELPEFSRQVLEALREPLESGSITISRAARQAEFPAKFQLIAAMNPCPCGFLSDSANRCRCTAEQVQRYRSRLSGPLLDRIDMHLEVQRLPLKDFMSSSKLEETSETVRTRVEKARQKQWQRAAKINSDLNSKELEIHCNLTSNDQTLLINAIERLNLSVRTYHRVLRVARTIADLADSDQIVTKHLLEALSYRRLEREKTA